MNLITEYKKRHKGCFIPVCHDGICFFELDNKPALIVLTSLSCRGFNTCVTCDMGIDSNVIVEWFVPGYGGNFMPIGHHHVDPITDLGKFLISQGLLNYKPYYASSPRDMETWLWRFCTQQSRFRGLKSVESDKQLKIIEQMVHSVQKHTKLYQSYYAAYEALLLNRKYILVGEGE